MELIFQEFILETFKEKEVRGPKLQETNCQECIVYVIFDTFLDVNGGSPLKTNSLNKITTLLSDHDLCDIFRVRFPDTQRFSWRQKNPLIQRRLGYFFISNEIQEDVAFIDIVASVASDHSIVH